MLKNFVFLGQIFIELENRRHIAATEYHGQGEYDIDKGTEHNMDQVLAKSTFRKPKRQ